MSRRTERLYPYLFGFLLPALALLALAITGISPGGQALSSMTQATLALAGTLVGFLATALTMLFALPDRPVIHRARELGAVRLLVSYLLSSIWHWLAVLLLSLGLLYIVSQWPQSDTRLYFALPWAYLLATGTASLFRATRLIAKLLRLADDEDEDEDEHHGQSPSPAQMLS